MGVVRPIGMFNILSADLRSGVEKEDGGCFR